MATLTFDKLAYVDRLKAAGMGEREAWALAEGLDQALREEVATKTDLAAEIASVRTELATVKHDILRWMVGMAFVQVGLTVALVRFLPH